MKYTTALLLICAGALFGCAHTSPVLVDGPKPQPIPESLMEPAKPDFYQRMLNFCCEKPPEPTKSQGD